MERSRARAARRGIGRTQGAKRLALRVMSSGGALALVAGLLAPGGAHAVLVDFEGIASGTDSALATLEGVTVAGGLVLDETSVASLLSVPAAGTWNTTPGGAQGVLNVLSPALTITFATPVVSFGFQSLSLPDGGGDPVTLLVLVEGVFAGVLEPGSTGDSGFPEHDFSFSAAPGFPISGLVLCVRGASDSECADPGLPTTFWIDDLQFEPVPEPATVALLALGLAGCAAARRRAPGPLDHRAGRGAPGPPRHDAGRGAPGPPSHDARRGAPGPPSHDARRGAPGPLDPEPWRSSR